MKWDKAVPSHDGRKACTVFDGLTRTVWDTDCKRRFPSICILDSTQTFRINGLCKNSILDDHYVIQKINASTVLFGDKSVTIQFDDMGSQWIAFDKKGTLLAAIKATKSSLLLGTHDWTIYNDTLDCQLMYKRNNYTLPLNLNPCNNGDEFTCDNGACIHLDKKCDGVSDCEDRSDESQCAKIQMDQTYSKKISPPGQNGESEFAVINITLDIIDIVKIDEVMGFMRLKLNITAEWHDKRLRFLNLKNETRLNELNDFESNYLWKPDLLYLNVISNEDREIFASSKVYIERNRDQPPLQADTSALKRTQIFGGKHSKIIYYEPSR